MLAAASRIVAAEGLAGLSLRPLAQALGVSVTVLSNHYGARADVIAAICRAAREHDTQCLDHWRRLLAGLGSLPPSIAADMAEAILDDLATEQRSLSVLYLETLHACTWDAALRPAFEPWAAERRAFWHEFAQRAGLAPALLECSWWQGYVVAELAYSVALNTVSSYRMLRRVCLQRLCAGGAAAAQDETSTVLFSLLTEQMQHREDGLAGEPATGRSPEWTVQAARACGIRLAEQGASGLTHRAIAADIGVPHTTLSYRFPTQYDLMVAGLESIAAHILLAVDAGNLTELQRLRVAGDGKKLDLARANFAVAIAAARMPELKDYTAGMRSRRGNNLGKVFEQYMPGARGIDGLCAQVVSMGLTGLTNLEPPGEASERSVASAFAATAKWLQAGAGQPIPGRPTDQAAPQRRK